MLDCAAGRLAVLLDLMEARESDPAFMSRHGIEAKADNVSHVLEGQALLGAVISQLHGRGFYLITIDCVNASLS